ncbi:hypothetical protein ACFXTN_030002 [Malus domestica]
MLACSLQASCVHPYLHLTVRLLEPIKQRVSPSSSAAANLGIAESDNAINPHTSPSPATSTASKQLGRNRNQGMIFLSWGRPTPQEQKACIGRTGGILV